MRSIKKKENFIYSISLPFVIIFIVMGVRLSMIHDAFISKEVAENFVISGLVMQNGGVRTKFKDEKFEFNYPGGSDVLSESQGLLMRYAVADGNEKLFADALFFIERVLYTDGIISYRYSENYGTFPANASIDDFRIIRALLEASDTFDEPEYEEKALLYANELYATNTDGKVLYDFYETKHGHNNSFLTLCYADFKTMMLLNKYDERWGAICEYAQPIVENGYISDEFPLFATSYDYKSGKYKAERIETIQSLLTAIHLAEINLCPDRTIEYVKEKVVNKELFGAYSSRGKARNNYQSAAVYALASILGKAAGDIRLQSAALTQMKSLQVDMASDPLHGAFGNAQTQEAYSFDNLCALLAFVESR